MDAQHADRGARRHVSPRRLVRARVPARRRRVRRELQSRGRGRRGVLDRARRRTVVDVWGGWRDRAMQAPWDAPTTVCMMSVAKGITAICFNMLIDRGLVDPNARVIEYWPEYGRNGKEKTLVRHFLDHTAAVPVLTDESALAGRDVRPRGDHQSARGAGAAVGDRHEGGLSRPSSGLPARRDHAPRHRQDRRAVPARGSRDAARRRVLHRRHDRRGAGVRRRGDAEHGGEAVRREGRRRSNLAAGRSRSSRTRTSRGPRR